MLDREIRWRRAVDALLTAVFPVNSTNGKARLRRGGQRKFWRRVAVMKRSSPLSSEATVPAGLPPLPGVDVWNRNAAWFARMVVKKSAVGTKTRKCSFGWIGPLG